MFRTTADSVLSALNKAITDLEVVAERSEGYRQLALERVNEAVSEAERHRNEGQRAQRVKERLEALLN